MILKPVTGVGEPTPSHPYLSIVGKRGSYSCKTQMPCLQGRLKLLKVRELRRHRDHSNSWSRFLFLQLSPYHITLFVLDFTQKKASPLTEYSRGCTGGDLSFGFLSLLKKKKYLYQTDCDNRNETCMTNSVSSN